MAQLLPADPAALRTIIAFQDLPPEVLDWLGQAGELRRFAAGETVMAANGRADQLVAVVAGSVQFYTLRDGRSEPVFRLGPGHLSGALPYARLAPASEQGVTVGDTTLFQLPCSQFPALEQVSPLLVQRLVDIMSDRARDEARAQERDDKLRALGKLSAGLSHELNNPAAAISRAAASLTASLQVLPTLLLNLLATVPPADAVANVTALAVLTPERPAIRSALAAVDEEEALADWLETQGCPDGYALAADLLAANLTAAALTPVAAQLPAAARPAAFAWLSGHLAAQRFSRDIGEAGQRISALVGDVKIYSHMDRATGRERLAVTSGLDSTLNMFAYALRQKNGHLTRDYAPDLPLIMGQAGSLNQVWTNLIDNALDALPDQGGELTVRVGQQAGFVCVGIQDNGPGITPAVLAHLFEPFYTTKPPGEGTGQGLGIALHIVQEHGGRLEAASEPGRTEFTVWLPIS
ncbi:sensor histidine kinase [Hymenobacter terricola]|uniref:sensor histidine kinase n=1 Tax=Hymenobacter terricola TaxID=2819236 RepID=UPI001B312AFE|nr:ATP-binding protein [Hymenobacter terricola]